jgi:hypothetical protein
MRFLEPYPLSTIMLTTGECEKRVSEHTPPHTHTNTLTPTHTDKVHQQTGGPRNKFFDEELQLTLRISTEEEHRCEAVMNGEVEEKQRNNNRVRRK